MPVYDAQCTMCSQLSQYTSSVESRTILPLCPYCAGVTKKVIVNAPRGYVKGNFATFKSPVDGSVISTERDLREHNARNGVMNIHEGYDETKIVSGDFGKKIEGPDPKEIANDVGEALHKLQYEGYVPPPREAYHE
jgi:hypothetical protein